MTQDRPSRLLRVAGPATTGDFAVTADSTVEELVPLLAEALGLPASRSGAGPVAGWLLCFEGRALAPEATASSAGLLDGDALVLVERGSDDVRQELTARVVRRAQEPDPDKARHRFGAATGGEEVSSARS